MIVGKTEDRQTMKTKKRVWGFLSRFQDTDSAVPPCRFYWESLCRVYSGTGSMFYKDNLMVLCFLQPNTELGTHIL